MSLTRLRPLRHMALITSYLRVPLRSPRACPDIGTNPVGCQDGCQDLCGDSTPAWAMVPGGPAQKSSRISIGGHCRVLPVIRRGLLSLLVCGAFGPWRRLSCAPAQSDATVGV